jgi:nucleoside-diphosphate-sugar epimerase
MVNKSGCPSENLGYVTHKACSVWRWPIEARVRRAHEQQGDEERVVRPVRRHRPRARPQKRVHGDLTIAVQSALQERSRDASGDGPKYRPSPERGLDGCTTLRILVTGAAGLIGSELCGQLAERGHAVLALIHRTSVLRRNNGRMIKPAPYSGARLDRGAVLAVKGDVREDRLGFQPEVASAVASVIDLIVHCAAETGFQLAPDSHTVNVEGTRNVIAFARCAKRCPPGLVHVSTAYVSGERSGPILEDELDLGQIFANDYEATKARAESIVHESGLPAAIARPSIVVGDSATGAIGRFRNVYGLLKLIGSGQVTVLPTTSDASLDFVPINHVINGLTCRVLRRCGGKHFPLGIWRSGTNHRTCGARIPRLSCASACMRGDIRSIVTRPA